MIGLAITAQGQTSGTVDDDDDVIGSAMVVRLPISGTIDDDDDVSALPAAITFGTIDDDDDVSATPDVPPPIQGVAVATAGDLLVTVGDNAETLYI